MVIFKFFQKSQITWNWKSSKKYIPTQHWLYCKKTSSLIKIFKSFHQFLPMYGNALYCKSSRLINFLKSLLHCIGPYIFCKVSLHTSVTQLPTQWNIPSLIIMALQVDWLHILLVLCLLELCVLHCFKVLFFLHGICCLCTKLKHMSSWKASKTIELCFFCF